ncbi:Adenylate and Guanylate cyclase catalytic domain-containing protein [Mariprofundus ferrinatatus]|uniref:Adenylate and Guanylate cyclase catalytic domain-containing protein n=1 Tax=Mariprofundus ferrinatatus TaxID=1921087 RepID=A0A2K8L6L9_9PROT|nr:adenylate/guanylate cyclase domain-containing protein [Mariprofundus ferrinatatus]ATX82927.1 Adenylate and Guanylate cyclase catalytic domain-containing protein [Mariprofundus ferrinatatus]
MSLRWSWSLFAAFLTLAGSAVMALSIIAVERDALRVERDDYVRYTLSMLSGALRMPMMADSRTEVDRLMEEFVATSPGSIVYLRWANGESEQFGEGVIPDAVSSLPSHHLQLLSVEGQERWYAQGVNLNKTDLGVIALHMPAPEEDVYSSGKKLLIAMVALLLAMLAGALMYRFSGTLTDLMRRISMASRQVGGGDFSVHIPGYGSGEIGEAVGDFNQMVSRLSHRQMTHEVFGRYQSPQQVSDGFERTLVNTDHPARTVAVMAVEMVDFAGYISDLRELGGLSELNRFFRILHAIVSENGGHLDAISGGHMVAVFNHPFNLRNYQDRAAKCALELIEASKMLSLHRSDGSTVAFKIGLAQGEVLTGFLGAGRHREFRAVGAAVSLAEHLALLGSEHDVIAGGEILHQLAYAFEKSGVENRTLAGGESLQVAKISPKTERLIAEVQKAASTAIHHLETEGATGVSK